MVSLNRKEKERVKARVDMMTMTILHADAIREVEEGMVVEDVMTTVAEDRFGEKSSRSTFMEIQIILKSMF